MYIIYVCMYIRYVDMYIYTHVSYDNHVKDNISQYAHIYIHVYNYQCFYKITSQVVTFPVVCFEALWVVCFPLRHPIFKQQELQSYTMQDGLVDCVKVFDWICPGAVDQESHETDLKCFEEVVK